MKTKNLKAISLLSIILALPLIIVSFIGAFIPSTYSRETISLATQGIGQDIINLFVVVPVLLISVYYANRSSKIAMLILGGTLSYILYSFIIYCFGIHFNRLFLLYCTILGLSLFALIITMKELTRTNSESWIADGYPIKTISTFLFVVAILFYLIWLKDIVPAIINNSVPKSVSEMNLLVNPVHVIDISIALPTLILTSILLRRKRDIGFILTPILLVFIILMALALAGMGVMMMKNNIVDDFSIVLIFLLLAIFSGTLLWRIRK